MVLQSGLGSARWFYLVSPRLECPAEFFTHINSTSAGMAGIVGAGWAHLSLYVVSSSG